VDRGEFQDLNLRYKSAFEAYKLAVARNMELERTRGTVPEDWIEEQRAMAALRFARREILIALGVEVTFED